MKELNRITLDPDVMGGKPCIRGMRATVGTMLGLLASGTSEERILEASLDGGHPAFRPACGRSCMDAHDAWTLVLGPRCSLPAPAVSPPLRPADIEHRALLVRPGVLADGA